MLKQNRWLGTHVDNVQVGNVVDFPPRELKKTIKAKKALSLYQCGNTRNCITSSKENLYNCYCWEKCKKVKDILEIFI